VKFFADNMVGLTGTPDQVAAAAKAYRVYYAKVDDKDGDAATYLMDHSALSYLMGPDGRFVQFFRHELDAAEVADRLRKLL
jgi:protein SCO1/2